MKLCNEEFKPDETYETIFAKYPFPLSNFQKWAIKGIRENKSVLITAHTGSGKTLPAEHAIEYFVKQLRKKVIYTCPIKALSNEKFGTLQEKYPNISFGLLTGDVKFNPEADVLIMTTEILRNTLFQKKLIENNETISTNLLHFDIDINYDLGAVVFDEIHYFGDRNRGAVWEESIMMLPKHITLIGLSATIDKQQEFCNWIEGLNKEMYLCPNDKRVVPLKEFMFLTYPPSCLTKFNKETQKFMIDIYEKNALIKKEGTFSDKTYYNYLSALKYLEENKIRVKPEFVLNRIISHMNETDSLPAIMFVFSKKQIHKYAKKITVPLFDKESKIPSTIRQKCIQIIKAKVPNFKEYTSTVEFEELVSLLEKGIGIHHSGITSIFREMVEMLFSQKIIKVLFATETFSVGINVPVKSVVFTSITKYSDEGFRTILPNEYTQMAGRAGRRGIDTEGKVFNLVNLFKDDRIYGLIPTIENMKYLLSGKPPVLKSRFNIHYNMILRLISNNNLTNMEFINNSMYNKELQEEIVYTEKEIEKIQETIQDTKNEFDLLSKTSEDTLEKYIDLQFKKKHTANKQRKTLGVEMRSIRHGNVHFERDFELYKHLSLQKEKKNKLIKYVSTLNNFNKDRIQTIINLLKQHKFINEENKLTNQGLIASNLQEFNSLAMGEIINYGYLNCLKPHELVSVLSIFTNIKLCEHNKIVSVDYLRANMNVKETIKAIKNCLNKYYDMESRAKTNFVEDYDIHYDMVDFMTEWCEANTEKDCIQIFNEAKYYDIFVGDFVKAILKINNMANELEKICLLVNNLELLKIVKQIPELTLKNIATIQSLYL